MIVTYAKHALQFYFFMWNLYARSVFILFDIIHEFDYLMPDLFSGGYMFGVLSCKAETSVSELFFLSFSDNSFFYSSWA